MTSLTTNPTLSSDSLGGIDLRMVLRILRYWLWLLFVGALGGAVLGYFASLQTLPIYRTELLLLIEETRPLTAGMDVALEGRTSTYLELINEGLMLETIAVALELDPAQLAETVTSMRVESLRNTQLFRVYVEGYHPEYLTAVANSLPQVLRDEMTSVRTERFAESRRNLATQIETIKAQIDITEANLDRLGTPRSVQQENQQRDLQTVLAQQQNSYANLVQSFENLRLMELQSMDNIAMVRSAELPENPIASNMIPNILLGAIVGLGLVLVVISMIEYFDDRVRSPSVIQDSLGVTILGAVDVIASPSSAQSNASLITLREPRHPISESYRSIRTNLRFSTVDRKLETMLVTSAMSGEGKSLTAANLSIVMAQLGLSVVLIDGDMRKPSQHTRFQLRRQPGLSDALIAEDDLLSNYLQNVEIPNLQILTSGATPPNPAELLSSQRMQQLIAELHKQADVVIIDTPPLLLVTDAAVLTDGVRDVIVVANAKRTQLSSLTRTIESLRRIDAHICGVIVNELSRSSRGYSYYGEYYAQPYGTYYGESRQD